MQQCRCMCRTRENPTTMTTNVSVGGGGCRPPPGVCAGPRHDWQHDWRHPDQFPDATCSWCPARSVRVSALRAGDYAGCDWAVSWRLRPHPHPQATPSHPNHAAQPLYPRSTPVLAPKTSTSSPLSPLPRTALGRPHLSHGPRTTCDRPAPTVPSATYLSQVSLVIK